MILQKTATKLLFPLCSIIVSLGGLTGIVLQDNLFAHYLFAIAGLQILIPFVLLLTVIAIVLLFLKQKINKWITFPFAFAGALILAIILFLVVNLHLDAWKNDNVRKYVAHAVPVLDEIKSRTGSFPLILPVASLGEPPSLFRHYGNYESDGKTFTFEYIDEPAGWAGGEGFWEFNSSEREWRLAR